MTKFKAYIHIKKYINLKKTNAYTKFSNISDIYIRKYALKLGEEIYSFCLTAEKLSIGNGAVAQL